MKKILAFIILGVYLSQGIVKVNAQDSIIEQFNFNLKAHVYDYGQAINQVEIQVNKPIDQSSIDNDTYTVIATATNPYDVGSNPSSGTYSKVEREISGVRVSNEGKIVIDLKCKYKGSGQGTLNYVGGEVNRNLSMNIEYEVIQNKEFSLTDGTIVKETSKYLQEQIIDDEVDLFAADSSNGINYQKYIPSNANDGNKHPLIVWFHGNGEGGYKDIQNNTSQLTANRGAVTFVSELAQATFNGAYVLAPQVPDTWYYNYSNGYIEKMTNLIKEMIVNNNIDSDQVYLYGCSAGGYMAIRMAIENLNTFAAVIPTCPAISVAQERGGKATTDEEILLLRNTPMWLVHAKNDTTINYDESSNRIYKLLSTVNNNITYTQYDDVQVDTVEYPGHWAWVYTARNMPVNKYSETIWTWSAKQRLIVVEQPSINEEVANNIVVTSNEEHIGSYLTLWIVSLGAIVCFLGRKIA